jgi:SpoVK/Ycf46/Vps4 family AAA+-type ATPase
MDGISAKNGLLVIATANNVKKLQTNITKRPSRFDRKWEIPPPTLEMAHIYLKRWFDKLLTNNKMKELAQTAIKHELSYAYLKELYITSMFEALAHNRKGPTEKDIDNTLGQLIRDKNLLNSGGEINTDKYFK